MKFGSDDDADLPRVDAHCRANIAVADVCDCGIVPALALAERLYSKLVPLCAG